MVLSSVGNPDDLFVYDESSGKDAAEGLPGFVVGRLVEIFCDDRFGTHRSQGKGGLCIEGIGAHDVMGDLLPIGLHGAHVGPGMKKGDVVVPVADRLGSSSGHTPVPGERGVIGVEGFTAARAGQGEEDPMGDDAVAEQQPAVVDEGDPVFFRADIALPFEAGETFGLMRDEFPVVEAELDQEHSSHFAVGDVLELVVVNQKKTGAVADEAGILLFGGDDVVVKGEDEELGFADGLKVVT